MYFITGATIFSAFAFLGGSGMGLLQGGRGVLHPGVRRALGFVPFYFPWARARHGWAGLTAS